VANLPIGFWHPRHHFRTFMMKAHSGRTLVQIKSTWNVYLMHDSFNILKVRAVEYLIDCFPKVSRFIGIIYYIVVRIRALQVDCLHDRNVGTPARHLVWVVVSGTLALSHEQLHQQRQRTTTLDTSSSLLLLPLLHFYSNSPYFGPDSAKKYRQRGKTISALNMPRRAVIALLVTGVRLPLISFER